MIFPSKFTSYEESIINKMILILETKKSEIFNINLLYKNLEKEFENIDDFIFALDALFALGYVGSIENQELKYVG